MGKLVLFLADGTTMDVPLDKDRIIIGRRADNDVCLPYPAVSGEHAAVVTILADSFLEDLGSTNGTLVNGKVIVKHFLNDHDQIDIGRQRLTYMSDNDAKVDALPADILRNQLRGLHEKVEPARRIPHIDVPPPGVRSQFGTRDAPPLADLERDAPAPGRAPPMLAMPSAEPLEGPITRSRLRERATGAPNSRAPARVAAGAIARPPARETRKETMPAPEPVAEAAAPPVPPPSPVPSVRVLSGASLGRTVPFPGEELSVGRVGIQVAVVRKVVGGYRLVPLEGSVPPKINGAPVPPEGSPLHPGDTFEVAGVRLELSVES